MTLDELIAALQRIRDEGGEEAGKMWVICPETEHYGTNCPAPRVVDIRPDTIDDDGCWLGSHEIVPKPTANSIKAVLI